MNVIMFGPPGSGKGTQSAVLAESCKLRHVSTGDLLRDEISQGTVLGKQVASIIEKGDLVSDDLILAMIEHVVDASTHAAGIVFDGFPRTVVQAEGLARLLRTRNQQVDVIFNLEVTREAIMARIHQRATEEGRSDDTSEVVGQRMQEYDQKTAPVLAYYRSTATPIVVIDGLQARETISTEIQDQVSLLMDCDGPAQERVSL